jgi:polysaccharide pyruvyl transferase WcaK-like protein
MNLLLRSGWQTVNIGDIAHTPGLLTLLGQHLPEARITLWSNALDRGVREMLARHFPRLRFVSGDPGSPEVRAAMDDAQALLHGSGPGLVARAHVEAWRAHTPKPWGVCGITVPPSPEPATPALGPELKALLDSARFVYTRETLSLGHLKQAPLQGPALDFFPDATFALQLNDDARANAFLQQHGLAEGGYLCVVPRLRVTPYHKIRPTNWTPEEINRRETLNARHAEPDHAKLREAIIAWVRQTRRRVLLVPEMSYAVDIMAELLETPLPADVRPFVVRRPDYWITDEAASTYKRAAAVLSCECHSPIIAAAVGTPGFYVHQPEDGIKGHMWTDVGLASNYFDIETAAPAHIAGRVLDCALHPDRERRRIADARARIAAIHQRLLAPLPRLLGLA